jgi:PAS domain-containing protein
VTATAPPPRPALEADDLADLLVAFDQRVESIRSAAPPAPDAALAAALVELETCREELRVAEEQLREARGSADAAGARVAGSAAAGTETLPVAVLTCDPLGVVLGANAAASDLLGVRAFALPGKPLTVYVDQSSRAAFRAMLAAAVSAAEPAEVQLVLRPRQRGPVDVTAVALPPADRPEGEELTLVLVAQRGASPVRTAAALAGIAALPGDVSTLAELVERLAPLVRGAIDGATTVSVLVPRHRDDPVVGVDPAGHDVEAEVQAAAAGQRVVLPFPGAALDGSGGRRTEGEIVVAAPGLLTRLRADGRDTHRADAVAADLELLVASVASVVDHVMRVDALRREADELAAALRSRAIIDQAKGMVMMSRGCSADEAFTILVQNSQRANVKVRVLAERMVVAVAEAEGGSPLRR